MNIIPHPLNGTHPDWGWRYLDTTNNLAFPWYTLDCLKWLITIDIAQFNVFEYGCGWSSLWWQNKVKYWNGVDSNIEWGSKYGFNVPVDANGKLDNNKYLSACLDNQYDIIVNDGACRDECTEYALKAIKPNGYIICDNWDQESIGTHGNFWNKTKNLLKQYPCNIYHQEGHPDWKTAVFQII